MHDNTQSKSKYVRVLMCCLNGNKVTAIDWAQLHETIPGFKHPILNRAEGAIDKKLNKVLINIKQQTSKAGFPYHNTLINHNPVNQALYEKIITIYNEHFDIAADEVPLYDNVDI